MKKLRLSLVGLILMTLLAGCLNDSGQQQPQTPIGSVSFFNACPNGPNINVLIDDASINTSQFGFGTFTGYGFIRSGTRGFKFKSATDQTLLIDTTYAIEENNTYSIFVTNPYPKIKSLLVHDVASLQLTTDCMVRFIHLSPDSDEITVNLSGGISLFSGSYKGHSEFTEMVPNAYTLEVHDAADGHLIMTTPVSTMAGQYYTVIFEGYALPPPNNTNTLSLKVINN